MRSITATVIVVAAMAAPLGAQERSRWSPDRIPPGHMPPAGSCRVWYDGLPPGQQPPPMSCQDAERLAARSRGSRVVYGEYARTAERDATPDSDRAGTRSPHDARYESRYPYRVNSAAYENGYRDGVEKGREDAGDGDSFDPVRHSRYRSADHGYERGYGSKDEYKLVYRDGFESGYREGYGEYRAGRRDNRDNTGGARPPWPF